MIYYLDSNNSLLFYTTLTDVIVIEYLTGYSKPQMSSVRWKRKSALQTAHIDNIHSYLRSHNQVDRDIGKTLLEETMKIKINGRVIGYDESQE